VEREITTRLAAYKRPRRLHVVEQLPRTATGKLVRDHAVLRDMRPSGSATPVTTAARADAGRQAVVSNLPLPKGDADHDG
jgi:hypothetical protein